jgi:8-oxo-dGTP diphosphatase
METKICLTACIYDPKSKRILVVKRSEKETFFPGVFEMPGGKLEFGENVEKGLIREAHEEVGLTVKSIKPVYVVDYMSKNDTQYNVEIGFLCNGKKTDTVKLSAAHTKYQWISEGDLALLLTTDEMKRRLAICFREISKIS